MKEDLLRSAANIFLKSHSSQWPKVNQFGFGKEQKIILQSQSLQQFICNHNFPPSIMKEKGNKIK